MAERRMAMRRQPELGLEWRGDPRPPRRCRGCGAFVLAGVVVDGALLCERCALKARRDRAEVDRTEVDFLLN